MPLKDLFVSWLAPSGALRQFQGADSAGIDSLERCSTFQRNGWERPSECSSLAPAVFRER